MATDSETSKKQAAAADKDKASYASATSAGGKGAGTKKKTSRKERRDEDDEDFILPKGRGKAKTKNMEKKDNISGAHFFKDAPDFEMETSGPKTPQASRPPSPTKAPSATQKANKSPAPSKSTKEKRPPSPLTPIPSPTRPPPVQETGKKAKETPKPTVGVAGSMHAPRAGEPPSTPHAQATPKPAPEPIPTAAPSTSTPAPAAKPPTSEPTPAPAPSTSAPAPAAAPPPPDAAPSATDHNDASANAPPVDKGKRKAQDDEPIPDVTFDEQAEQLKRYQAWINSKGRTGPDSYEYFQHLEERAKEPGGSGKRRKLDDDEPKPTKRRHAAHVEEEEDEDLSDSHMETDDRDDSMSSESNDGSGKTTPIARKRIPTPSTDRRSQPRSRSTSQAPSESTPRSTEDAQEEWIRMMRERMAKTEEMDEDEDDNGNRTDPDRGSAQPGDGDDDDDAERMIRELEEDVDDDLDDVRAKMKGDNKNKDAEFNFELLDPPPLLYETKFDHLANVDKEQLREWGRKNVKIIGHACDIVKDDSHDRELAEDVRRFLAHHSNCTPHVAPPIAASANAEHPRSFLIKNISQELADDLVDRVQILSTPKFSIILRNFVEPNPSFVFQLQGFLPSTPIEIVEYVVKRAWDFRTWGETMIVLASEYNADVTPEQIVKFVNSVKVKYWPVLKKGGADAGQWTVSANGAIFQNAKAWREVKILLSTTPEIRYQHADYGNGKVVQRPMTCSLCHACDHPRGLCPLPKLPGWQGPSNEKPKTDKRRPKRDARSPRPQKRDAWSPRPSGSRQDRRDRPNFGSHTEKPRRRYMFDAKDDGRD